MPDNAIAAGVDINPLKTYGNILGIQQQQTQLAQQRQTLQTGEATQQTAQAQASQTQQDVQERAAVTPVLQNPEKYGLIDEQGVIRPEKAIPLIQRLAPKTNGQYVAPLMEGFRAQLAVSKDAQELNVSRKDDAYRTLTGITQDDTIKTYGDMVKAVDLASKQNPALDPFFKNVLGQLSPTDPLSLTMGKLKSLGRTVQPVEKNLPAPTALDVGGSVATGVTEPRTGAFTPSGQNVPKTLTPGVSILTDAYGRQFRYNQQSNKMEPVGTGGTDAGPAAAKPTAPVSSLKFAQPAPNQAQVTQDIEGARKAGDQYGLNSHINNRLLELSKSTDTGPGTEKWHNILGALGAPIGASPAADYQLINAYLDRQAALSNTSMGLPNTNAGLATSQSLSGTTSFSPPALQEKVKLTQSLNEGARAFRTGLDRAVGVGENPDTTAYQKFRSAWAANFDPTVFALDAAHKRNDTAEVNAILGKMDQKGAAALQKKAEALRMLEKGKIPE